ncbi:hypothetical protein P9112_002714 [Eukaryota sp. TZLM1-RC]
MSSKKYTLSNQKSLKLGVDQSIINHVRGKDQYTVVNRYTDAAIALSFIAVVAGAFSRWYPIPPEHDRMWKLGCLVVYVLSVSLLKVVSLFRGRNCIVVADSLSKGGRIRFFIDTCMKKADDQYHIVVRSKHGSKKTTSISIGQFFYEDGQLETKKVDETLSQLIKEVLRKKQQ